MRYTRSKRTKRVGGRAGEGRGGEREEGIGGRTGTSILFFSNPINKHYGSMFNLKKK